ncbi:MAG: CoA pyrophosphatase [Tissierellia bacterium]|nr:CoA pyrophosphatase [Tissierellia bacterium]
MKKCTIETIEEAIKNFRPGVLGVDHMYSVAITLMERDGQIHVLFEKRAETLNTQPGEVSFPGGAIEEGESPREAAFRETLEELRIPADNLTILKNMGFMVTRYGAAIHCYLAYIEDMTLEEIDPNPDEVGSLFTVPLRYFLDVEPETYTLEFFKGEQKDDFPYELIRDGYKYKWRSVQDLVEFYRYDDHGKERVIWGFTAKMMRNVAETLRTRGV